MKEEIKEILDYIDDRIIPNEKWNKIKDCITNLQEENKRLNNIINELEKFFKYEFDNEVRPLNDRKISVWTICLDKLKELKEGK